MDLGIKIGVIEFLNIDTKKWYLRAKRNVDTTLGVSRKIGIVI